MPSIQTKMFNFFVGHTIKPILNYYTNKYMATQNIKIIERVRKVINCLPIRLPADASTCAYRIANIPIIAVSAKENPPLTTIIYLHGGGHVICSAKFYTGFAYRLAASCAANVILVDYSLAPENKYPAALNEVIKVYTELKQKNQQGSIFIAGDSSGGGLAIAVTIAIKEKNLPLPAGVICFSPWTDLALTGESIQKNSATDCILTAPLYQIYTDKDNTRHPLVSPLYASLEGLPPVLIHVSSTEILYDDSIRLADKAQAAGVKVTIKIEDNLPHVWPIFAKFVPEAKHTLENVKQFINANENQNLYN